MILYLLKVIACSGLLYAFYYYFLQKEKMLVFNRFFLLGSLLFSFLIPFSVIQIRLKPVALQSTEITAVSAATAAPVGAAFPQLLISFLFGVIGIVSSILLLRFIIHLFQIGRKIKGNEQRAFEDAQLVLLQEPVMPYTFFKYIFLNKVDFEQNRVEVAILVHELTHARQKHTWDIVLIELMGALMWFNPFLLLYRRSIRLNHEFLADQTAGGKPEHRVAYQQLLLKSIYVNQSIPLASSFYFLTTKKRLLMLQQETNRFRTGIKAMVVAPVLALLIFTFAERVYTQELPPPPKAPKEQKMPEEIKSLSVITPKGKAVAVLTYKNGKTVKADISSAEKQAAFESKYEVEILPPPPPPKAPKEQKMPEDIKRVSVIAPKGKAVAVLTYKNGKTVKADISSVEKQAAFESKYGVEIPPPPPPAIVPATREAPAASASPVIFVATASEALTDPKQQYKFVAEPVPAAAVKERVTPPRRTAAKQPPGLVPAGDTQIREVRRSEDIQVPVKIKIPAVDRAAAD